MYSNLQLLSIIQKQGAQGQIYTSSHEKPDFSSRPSKNNFFLAVHYLNSFVPIAQQAGQVAVLGRLSLSKCLWW